MRQPWDSSQPLDVSTSGVLALQQALQLLPHPKLLHGCRVDSKVPCWELQVVEKKTVPETAGGRSSVHGSTNGGLTVASPADPKQSRREEFKWTDLISQHAKAGQGRQALRVYDEMLKCGVQRRPHTFVAALKACSNLRDLERARQIHAEVVQSGVEPNVHVGTMLLDVYSKCGSIVDARRVFDNMPQRNVVAWNAMISGYAQLGNGVQALELYEQMQQDGFTPNERTFVAAVKACGSLALPTEGGEADGNCGNKQCLEKVRAIHADVLKSGVDSNIFVGNMLVDVYAKCGSLNEAQHVFQTMPQRNVVSWTAMILGHVQMEEAEAALKLYASMRQQGVTPDDRAFVGALKACTLLVTMEEGDKGHTLPVRKGCLEKVRAIHSDVVKAELECDVYVGTTLVDAYAKCGSLEDARLVFERMPRRNVFCWTAMILGYAQMEQGEVALQLYSKMQREGVIPDNPAFVGALKACGALASLEQGQQVDAQISSMGRTYTDLVLPNALIDMYGKCGSMNDAQQIFESMPTRDVVTWSALIAGYSRHGETALVFGLFQKMRQEGVHPNGITFLSILSACSHGGLVDKGQSYFEAMSRDYGLTPTTGHYIAMVDLFGRAGHLDKAMKMVKAMPVQSDGALWKAVLGACRKWKNTDLGREAFEHAVKLDRQDAAVYVLMSNIYAAAHMWNDVREIQDMRKKAKAWKQPGQSWWTDIAGVVHTFTVGDREHADSKSINAKLRELVVQMKKRGYTPHLDSVLRDIPDNEKEDALCEHSEKLAIAHALLKTSAGTTIRVVKNLRVCEDCHKAAALISELEQRTIICRDGSRFHVFKEGKCSCGDFW